MPLFVKRERLALEFGELDPTPPGVNQIVTRCGCGSSLGPIDLANCDTGRVVAGSTGLESAVPRLDQRVELWNCSIGSESLFLEQVAAARDWILQILTRVAESPETMLGCRQLGAPLAFRPQQIAFLFDHRATAPRQRNHRPALKFSG